MEFKSKLLKLENAIYRLIFSSIMIILTIYRTIYIYGQYKEYLISDPSYKIYMIVVLIFWILAILFFIATLSYFIYVNKNIHTKERYIEIKDRVLTVPSSLTTNTKTLKIDDIDTVSIVGFKRSVLKIQLKGEDHLVSRRIYNVYEVEIKEMYEIIKRLITKNT